MAELLTVENLIALLTLTSLEIVLGIDNVVFIAILAGKLPPEQRAKGRNLGLGVAMFSRILLLLGISWIMGLTKPLFSIMEKGFSGRDLILLVGGLFLIGKSTFEIHDATLHKHGEGHAKKGATVSFGAVIFQIMLIDIVFSLDSVITAVGMADAVSIMIAAIVIAIGVMIVFSGAIATFIEKQPTIKVLALAFLLLIGVMLVAEGFGRHVEKGYIYFAMAFSLGVELVNMRVRRAGDGAKQPNE